MIIKEKKMYAYTKANKLKLYCKRCHCKLINTENLVKDLTEGGMYCIKCFDKMSKR